jgi:hypothetical protein
MSVYSGQPISVSYIANGALYVAIYPTRSSLCPRRSVTVDCPLRQWHILGSAAQYRRLSVAGPGANSRG